MSDVFREVDEAVREDQIKKFFKRYGTIIGAVVVVVVVGLGGWQVWDTMEESRRVDDSDAYAAALQLGRQGRVQASLEALGQLADPSAGEVGTLAAFAQARILLGEDQRESAVRIWDQVAASEASGPIYRDLALLLSVMHQIGHEPPEPLAERLTPLTGDGEPFRPLALELQAILAMDAGDGAKARELLEALKADPATPPDQQQRAESLLAAISG